MFNNSLIQPIVFTFFILDIMKVSRTAFFKKGELIVDSNLILNEYLSSWYIWMDLITAVSIFNLIHPVKEL